MKSLLTKLTLFSLALVLGGQFVFAQEAVETPVVTSDQAAIAEAQNIDGVPTDTASVSEYTTSVAGVNFTKVSDFEYKVNFTLKNDGAAQSGIKYRVSLRPLNTVDGDDSTYYSVTYPEIMAIGYNDTVSREVDFTVPDYMSGEYLVVVELGGEHGLVHSLGTSRDTVVLVGDAVAVVPTGCYINVEGEETEFNLTQGLDVETTEVISLNCLIKNPTSETLTLTPDFTTYVRNTWGEKITIGVVSVSDISLAAGEEKLVSIELPKAEFPQAFDVVVSFSNVGDITVVPVTAHYVIRGESATIHNVSLSASEYAVGDTAQVLVSWSGAAEDFEGSRNGGVIDPNEQLYVDASLHNLNGDSCAEINNQKLQQVTNGVTILDVPVTSACETIIAKIAIKNATGEVLTENTYNFASIKKADEEVGVGTGSESVYNMMFVAGAAIILFVLVAFIMYVRGKKTDNIIASVGVIIVAAFSIGAAVVYAGSYNSSTFMWCVSCPGWTLHTATIAFAGPSGTYRNNDRITFLGNIATASCANTRSRSGFYVNVYGPANKSYSRGADSFSYTLWAKDLPNGNYSAVSRWTDAGCQTILNRHPNYPPDPNKDHQCTNSPDVQERYYFSVANDPAGSVSASGCTIPDGASTCATIVSWNITGSSNPNLRNLTASYVYSWAASGYAWQTMWYGNNTVAARNGGTNLATINVAANCAAGTIWTAGACRGVPVLTFTASPTPINPGGSSALTWSVVGATNGCTASGAWSGGKTSADGTYSETVSPAVTSTYTLTCAGPGGSTVRSATVVVNPPVVTLTASPTLIGPGNSSTLTWTATGATSCTASGAWSGAKTNTGGNESVSPAVTSSYTITCTGPSGTTPVSATVTLPSATISATSCTVPIGASSCTSNVTWAAQNFLSTPSVLQGATAFSSAPTGTSVPRPANPTDRTFTVSDTGSTFTRSIDASIDCATGSVWAGGSCVRLPVINIESNPNIVRSGNTAPIDISIEANYNLTCTLSGGLQETFTHTASAVARDYTRTTPPLTSARVVHIECTHTVYPAVTAEDEVRVDVIPTVQEV